MDLSLRSSEKSAHAVSFSSTMEKNFSRLETSGVGGGGREVSCLLASRDESCRRKVHQPHTTKVATYYRERSHDGGDSDNPPFFEQIPGFLRYSTNFSFLPPTVDIERRCILKFLEHERKKKKEKRKTRTEISGSLEKKVFLYFSDGNYRGSGTDHATITKAIRSRSHAFRICKQAICREERALPIAFSNIRLVSLRAMDDVTVVLMHAPLFETERNANSGLGSIAIDRESKFDDGY